MNFKNIKQINQIKQQNHVYHLSLVKTTLHGICELLSTSDELSSDVTRQPFYTDNLEIDQHAYHLTALNMFNAQSCCVIEADHDFDIVSHHLLDEYNNRFELLAITKNDQVWDVSQIIVIGNYRVHYVVQPHTVGNQALYGKPVVPRNLVL